MNAKSRWKPYSNVQERVSKRAQKCLNDSWIPLEMKFFHEKTDVLEKLGKKENTKTNNLFFKTYSSPAVLTLEIQTHGHNGSCCR